MSTYKTSPTIHLALWMWNPRHREINSPKVSCLINGNAGFIPWAVCLHGWHASLLGYTAFWCKRELLLQHLCPWKELEHKEGKNRNQELKTHISQKTIAGRIHKWPLKVPNPGVCAQCSCLPLNVNKMGCLLSWLGDFTRVWQRWWHETTVDA